MSTWIVQVLEGTTSSDIASYFVNEEPILEVDDSTGHVVQFLNFIPRNGYAVRVGNVNKVPLDRVIAIIEEKDE